MAPVKKKRARNSNQPKAAKAKAKPPPKIKINDKGGAYFKGAAYSMDMKARFHVVLDQLKQQAAIDGTTVTGRALANKAQISLSTAIKVIHDDAKGVISEKKERDKPGMGSKSLSLEDGLFLLTLYRLQPSTSLKAFVKVLYEEKGTKVSPSTLSR
jgi:hypothetical protein